MRIEGREKTVSIETHAKWELLVAYKKAHVGAIFSPSHKMPFISKISCGYILCLCFPLQCFKDIAAQQIKMMR